MLYSTLQTRALWFLYLKYLFVHKKLYKPKNIIIHSQQPQRAVSVDWMVYGVNVSFQWTWIYPVVPDPCSNSSPVSPLSHLFYPPSYPSHLFSILNLCAITGTTLLNSIELIKPNLWAHSTISQYAIRNIIVMVLNLCSLLW